VDARGHERVVGDPRRWFSPSWSADGKRLVFTSDGDVYTARADGSGIARLTSTRDDDYDPALSPDGRSLAFARGRRLLTMRSGAAADIRTGRRTAGRSCSPPATAASPSRA